MDEHYIEQIALLRERMSRAETTLIKCETELESQTQKLDKLLSKLDRYEGKLGGVLIAAAAFIAFFKFVVSEGWEWVQKVIGGT
jgi:hypothetical protein